MFLMDSYTWDLPDWTILTEYGTSRFLGMASLSLIFSETFRQKTMGS